MVSYQGVVASHQDVSHSLAVLHHLLLVGLVFGGVALLQCRGKRRDGVVVRST